MRSTPNALHATRPFPPALVALKRYEAAVHECSLPLKRDPELPQAYLSRAHLLRELLIWDRALADLEQAAAWAHGDLRLQTGIMLTYAKCLQERPEHVRRWLAIASPANVSPGVGYADSNLGVDRCFSVMTAINRPGARAGDVTAQGHR